MVGRGTVLAVIVALAACKKKPQALPDAPPMPEDAAVDATPPPPDAMVPDGPPPPQGQELTTGGGRVQGSNYILDVQVGHGVGQQPAQGSGYVVEGNSPVKP